MRNPLANWTVDLLLGRMVGYPLVLVMVVYGTRRLWHTYLAWNTPAKYPEFHVQSLLRGIVLTVGAVVVAWITFKLKPISPPSSLTRSKYHPDEAVPRSQ